mgnify:CR=1 FL=1
MNQIGHHNHSSKNTFGFWIYLMSDCIMFAVLFATYSVLSNAIADGPSGKDFFNLKVVFSETVVLLFSSYASSMVVQNAYTNNKPSVLFWLFATLILGSAFTLIEATELYQLVSEGLTPQRSAFLSSLFLILGTHGLHIIIGLIWIVVMIHMILYRGLDSSSLSSLLCLSLFWHFLDIIWICVFTFVYLLGSL